MKLQFATSLKPRLALIALPCLAAVAVSAPLSFQEQLEADWLVQEQFRASSNFVSRPVTTQADAAGACDGVIDGRWGFHTAENVEPWWQVDLGAAQELSRVVIWNRCQAAERAARLRLRLSDDARQWRTVYQHDGSAFFGFTDRKPLIIPLTNEAARYLRVQLPDKNFLHLEEVEVFSASDSAKNRALNRPANQSSTSAWSSDHASAPRPPNWTERTLACLKYCERLAAELSADALDVAEEKAALQRVREQLIARAPGEIDEKQFLPARRLQRRLALKNPLLDFDTLLFTQRVPGSFNHMSDQYYGWFSKPGGGLYLLRGFRSGSPQVDCLTTSFQAPGSFLRPTLSYDARKVLFAWARYYPKLAEEPNKLNKSNVPEDAFFHLFEMNLDGSGLRQLTHGKYDDFDGRYLPDGRMVFLSTRRGQALQVGSATAAQSLTQPDRPDCYVRCGGGPERPVAVYTLHTMNADGTQLTAISPFEMFEWTPEIAHDGSILYSRWDYIDRDNMPYMGLWTISPQGANARIVYGNHTRAPHCAFEPKPVPGSRKIVFTASAHHAQTMGSLVLLDPGVGTEGPAPITRLTPEVPFPEIEGWPTTSYASPWPLSERFYLTAWGYEGARVPGPEGWNRWHAVQRPSNGMALYLFDAASGCRELLFADARFACSDPIPVKPRPRPPVLNSPTEPALQSEGRFLLTDVYRGLRTIQRGEIKSLRIVAVPPKTHPTMNFPEMGITRDDPGKCVLGTVPVEADGSAYFRVPAGVIVFFQALDARGVARQTMRTVTHVQPGQTLSCGGCHDPREGAPRSKLVQAGRRAPSRITAGPEGSWPLRYDRLIQPVIEAKCVRCHAPQSQDARAAKLDLTAAKSWRTLVSYGKPSLHDVVWEGYRRGFSIEGEGIAGQSALLALLTSSEGHYQVRLEPEEMDRFITWMDTYAQRAGSFDTNQEKELEALRVAQADLLETPSK